MYKELKKFYGDGDIYISRYSLNKVRTGDISLQEAALISLIESFQSKEGCLKSNDYLAGYLGCSVRRIQQMLRLLEEKNFIKRESGLSRKIVVEKFI